MTVARGKIYILSTFDALKGVGVFMDFGLSGKKALVTAASRGIGASIAIKLAREGALVAITARSE